MKSSWRVSLIAAAILPLHSPQIFCLSTQDKVRGTYENRIRFFSPPQKIFQVFSSSKIDGKLYLSYGDFLHALTPFSYVPFKSMSVRAAYFQEYLKLHEPEFLSFADCNGDGVISYPEFLFFLTLLHISDEEYRRAFGKEKVMDRHKFIAFLLQKKNCLPFSKKKTEKSVTFYPPDPRHINATEEDIEAASEELAITLFSKKERIALIEVLKVRDQFQTALLHYEVRQKSTVQFFTLDVNNEGSISGKNFAKSLLSSIHPHYSCSYYVDIEKTRIPGSISFPQFLAFHRLNHHRQYLQEQIQKNRGMSRSQLLKLCRDLEEMDSFFKENNCEVSMLTLDILFGVLDLDGNDKLDETEVLGVLKHKFELGSEQEMHWVEDACNIVKKMTKRVKLILGSL